jgi:hypothetical protein
MSIKEKYKTFAEAEANKKLELQHARNSRIREDQQIKLAQNMLQ